MQGMSDMEMNSWPVSFCDDVTEIGQFMGYFEKEAIPRMNWYFDIIVQIYFSSQFRGHFRMSQKIVKVLTRITGNCPVIPNKNNFNFTILM